MRPEAEFPCPESREACEHFERLALDREFHGGNRIMMPLGMALVWAAENRARDQVTSSAEEVLDALLALIQNEANPQSA